MSDFLEDVEMDVDIDLDHDEDPETALKDVKIRLDELYGGIEDLPDGHPQQGAMRLEVRVLERVRDQLEAML